MRFRSRQSTLWLYQIRQRQIKINFDIFNLIQTQDNILKQIKLIMKLKTPLRPNFSRYAKLCDQTFYHDSQPFQSRNTEQMVAKPLPQSKSSTYGFSSVSREKRGNFRFPIRLPVGEFTQYPNSLYGKCRNPLWSFSKSERYNKVPLIEYQVCQKHPVLKEDEQVKMRASISSMKQLIKDKVRSNRTTSYFSLKGKNDTTITRQSRNYSIVQPQQTSQVGFFTKTKIERPRYLSKEDLNKLEGQKDQYHYLKRIRPCPNGYVEFFKRRARQPNRNSKKFQTFLYSNKDENQFNNFQQNRYPKEAAGHIDMQKHLDRPDYTPDKLGPNTQPYSIDYTRINQNNIDLKLQGFRDKIVTRYDRVGPEPNTRLDSYIKHQELPGMLEMDRMLARNSELFPIVDPAIKKAGDLQMKEDLKKFIPFKEINQAHRPKNVQDFTKLVNQGV